jgi:hypothetical protein
MAGTAGRTNWRKARLKPPPSSLRIDAVLVGMVGLVGQLDDERVAPSDADAAHDD